MSLSAAALDAMLAAGCTAEQIVATVKAEIEDEQRREAARLERQRASNVERQQRFRDRRKGKRADDNARNGSNALRSVTPPNDIYSNPPEPCVPNGTPPLAEPKPDEVEQAVELWNETADRNGLPKVKGRLSGQRRQRLKARLAEHGLAGVTEAIEAVAKSPFCRGETSDFRADLGFLTRPDNFAKLIEGGFAPRPQSTAPPGRRNEPLDYFEHLRSQREHAA